MAHNVGIGQVCARAKYARGTAPAGFGHGDAGWALNGSAGRYDERGTDDDYTQAGNLFRLMPADAQERLTSNIAGALRDVPVEIRERQFGHFIKADPAYAAAVVRKVATLRADREPAPALSVAKESEVGA